MSNAPRYLTITLANVDRFSKFFHQLINWKIVYVYTINDFHLTCNMFLHYVVKWKIQKCCRIFRLNVRINKFN